MAQALWADDALEPGARLDAVITLVDASHVGAQLADSEAGLAAQRQVAYADVLLLNKTDLVSEAALIEAEAALRGINVAAPLLRTQRGVVDLRHILEVDTLALAQGAARRLALN